MEHKLSMEVKDMGIKTTTAFPSDVVADIQDALKKEGVTDSEVIASADGGVIDHLKVTIHHAHMKKSELEKIVNDYLSSKKS